MIIFQFYTYQSNFSSDGLLLHFLFMNNSAAVAVYGEQTSFLVFEQGTAVVVLGEHLFGVDGLPTDFADFFKNVLFMWEIFSMPDSEWRPFSLIFLFCPFFFCEFLSHEHNEANTNKSKTEKIVVLFIANTFECSLIIVNRPFTIFQCAIRNFISPDDLTLKNVLFCNFHKRLTVGFSDKKYNWDFDWGYSFSGTIEFWLFIERKNLFSLWNGFQTVEAPHNPFLFRWSVHVSTIQQYNGN